MKDEIVVLRPLAVLRGGLSGASFITEIELFGGEKKYGSFLAPRYELGQLLYIEEHDVESAIAKHGYDLLEEREIRDVNDWKDFVREINSENG